MTTQPSERYTQRIIPENPQPGERYMTERRSPEGTWDVCSLDDNGKVAARVAVGVFSEADARLLVFGAKAVEVLRDAVDWIGNAERHEIAVTTLADLEGRS